MHRQNCDFPRKNEDFSLRKIIALLKFRAEYYYICLHLFVADTVSVLNSCHGGWQMALPCPRGSDFPKSLDVLRSAVL